MLDEFTSRAAELHLPLFETYGRFQRGLARAVGRRLREARRLADEALATGRRSHGVNAEVAYAGVWFRLALDLGRLPETLPESERMLAANPRLRMWQIAVVRALVETDRLDDARRHFEDLVGLDGVHLRDNQMFLPATCDAGRGGAARSATRRGPPSSSARSSRTPTASPPAGWPASPSARSASTPGSPRCAAGDLDGAERHLDDADPPHRRRRLPARTRRGPRSALAERPR